MQNGAVPIVMNSCSVFGELIDHGESGILSADRSVERLSDAIVRPVKDPQTRKKMALTAVRASQRRGDNVIVSKWSEILS
jgi:glycosyltransferase involved in cell wall biosynthesis